MEIGMIVCILDQTGDDVVSNMCHFLKFQQEKQHPQCFDSVLVHVTMPNLGLPVQSHQSRQSIGLRRAGRAR